MSFQWWSKESREGWQVALVLLHTHGLHACAPLLPSAGFGGGVFGRGRGRRQNTQRDDSNMTQLGFAARRRA